MEIERADPDRIEVLGGKPGDKERYIESDFRIRSGLCPNGHGLMTMGGWGQECPTCGFTCNTMPDTPNGADAYRGVDINPAAYPVHNLLQSSNGGKRSQ